jgi:hypothetical protein
LERRAVGRAIREAEELTGRFYRIPGREWNRFPYDVVTRDEAAMPDAAAFADLVRLVAEHPRPAAEELYRIRLRDDRVLAAVHARHDGVALFPLLLYVLTHELVHVVRFAGGLAGFDAPEGERAAEERHVHDVTRKILRPVGGSSLRRVLDVYRDAAAPEAAGRSSPKYE